MVEPCCGAAVKPTGAGVVTAAAGVGCKIEFIILGLLMRRKAPPSTAAPPRIQTVGIENLRATSSMRDVAL
jgi:hypothetical protein